MFVHYRPDGAPEQTFTFHPRKQRFSIMERVEKAYGDTYKAWSAALQDGDMKARQILLWLCLTNEHGAHTVRLADVDFTAEELEVQLSREEAQAMVDLLVEKGIEVDDKTMREVEDSPSDPSLAGKALLPIVA